MIQSFLISSLMITSFIATPHLAQTDPVTAVRIYEDSSEKLEKIREQREEERQEREEIMEQNREERMEEMQDRDEKREEQRLQIQQLRDEKLQQKLLEMADRFEGLNDKWTEHWSNVLDRLSEVLVKIETRSDELASNGEDTTSVETAIAEAQSMIDAAQLAVDELAAKEYVFDADSEDTVGANVREQIQLFKNDSTEVRTSVFDAKKSVQAAFQELKDVFSNSRPELEEEVETENE